MCLLRQAELIFVLAFVAKLFGAKVTTRLS